MFDFAWSEFALIAVVALIAIGPKDMPVAIRAVTTWIRKARRMAAEFQTHVDEMVREADLHEVRESINEIRNFDIKGEVERSIDPDGSLRREFSSNPLDPVTQTTSVEELAVSEPVADAAVMELEPLPAEQPAVVQAPAFIPPNAVPPAAAPEDASEAPAFIPPEVVLERRLRPH
jgi:sec-independent protein translocase protein TatB